jgi:gas vesicle protein
MHIGKYESSDREAAGTAVVFLLIGLGVGALAGLLLAPKSGRQLRRDLKRGYEDAKDSLGEWADEAKERVREAGEHVRERGAEMAEEVRESVRSKVEPLRRTIDRG